MTDNRIKTPIESIIISVKCSGNYLEKLAARMNEVMEDNEVYVVDGINPTYWEPVGTPFISDDLISQMMVLYKNFAI